MTSPAYDNISHLVSGLDDSIASITALSGGCICQAFHVESQNGKHWFAKTHSSAPDDLFTTEAFSLKCLSETNSVLTPAVIAANQHCLLLEYLEPSAPAPEYWQNLGRQLALLHQQPQANFGYEQDNYCGETPQPNPVYDNGLAFFVEQRLNFQADLAKQRQLLSAQDSQQLQQLCKKLGDYLPNEPPSLLHGDLWSGNVFCGPKGQPWLVDPACYRGWREIDIAMTQLFGGFPKAFYQTYHHHYPLESGWQDRLDLYNLYPLLNHLNLFGRSYLSQIREILHRFV